MGNCLTVSSNPSSPSPSSSSARSVNAATTSFPTTVSISQLKASTPFYPILPFSTFHSNLGAMYTLGSELGRGQTGIIRTCTSRSSGALYACKSLSKLRLTTSRDVEDVIREVRIMKHLSQALYSHACPTSKSSLQNGLIPGSIVRLHDVIEDKESIHLVMELCRGGELFDRIVNKKRYPEAQAAYIIKSLLEIVQFCHSKGIMHRDIKPENILLVEDSDTSPIKLADFGLALEFSPGQKFSGVTGSTYYIAPEVLQGEYSEEVDVWSVGVVMYLLLSGTPPFCGATEQRIFNAIQNGVLRFPSNPWDTISSSAKDLITQLLHTNAKLRLTPAQALNHPWMLHHSKVSGHMQSNATSTTLSIAKNAENLGSHKSTFASALNQQTFGRAERSNFAKPGLSKTLMDIIASKDQRNMCTVSNSISGQKAQKSGWTCTVLNLNGNEETLVVDMGHEKYLIFHDKIKRKIGWKLLRDATVSQ